MIPPPAVRAWEPANEGGTGRDADGGGGSFNRGSEKPFFFLGAQKVADLPGRTPFCDGSKEEEGEWAEEVEEGEHLSLFQ